MDYIRITDDNIEKEHICCAMSGKQGVIKKEWLKQRFKEGWSSAGARSAQVLY